MPQTNLEIPNMPSGFVPQKLSYEEFLREYDGQYAEYVDGEIISNMSVTQQHDILVKYLITLLTMFVETKKIGKIHGEPYQMKMTFGDKTKGREPDIFFVSTNNFDRAKKQYFDGAADLVIEVISPESITRDYVDKFDEYEAAGVNEYWIIDPHRRTAIFYGFDTDSKYKMLSINSDGVFESRVIAGLWIKTDWLWQEELPNLLDVLKDWKLV
ncbi:MAG TPA: Uma2 family endonuclease [Pyrinomonadaceae bacterium]|nr:Uma2 family endonuclease [Pyrinomonadaceae bacterium]